MTIGPPPPDVLLGMARDCVEAGPFNGLILFATDDGLSMLEVKQEMRDELAMLSVVVMAGLTPRPQWVAVVADTYHLETDRADEVEQIEHGSLAQRFAAGDPRVGEQVIASCLCPDGPTYDWVQPYVRDEGEIDWREPEQMPRDATSEGILSDLMREVVGM